MWRALAVGLLGLGLAMAAGAQDDYPINVYPTPQADGPVKIDGRLEDPVWQKAPVVSGFTYFGLTRVAEVQTSFRVLYDRKYLYFGLHCDEPLMANLTPVLHARDEHAIFGTEAVEVFVDPGHTHDLYYQFAVNAAGSLYDSERDNPSWNSEALAGVERRSDYWSAVLAIPWQSLGVTPRAGLVVGFNVNRDRYLGPEKMWATWARVRGGFHDPIRFAHLVLSGTPEEIAGKAGDLRKGDRSGPIVVYSAEGFSQTTYAGLAARSFRDLEKLLGDLDKLRQHEGDPGAAAELGRRLEDYRGQIAAMKTEAGGKLDAVTWIRLDVRIQGLVALLQRVVWEAG